MSKETFRKAQAERIQLKELRRYRRQLPPHRRAEISVEYRKRSPVHFAVLLVSVLGIIAFFLAERLGWIESSRDAPLWAEGLVFLIGAGACQLLFDARRSVGLSRNAGLTLSLSLGLLLAVAIFAV